MTPAAVQALIDDCPYMTHVPEAWSVRVANALRDLLAENERLTVEIDNIKCIEFPARIDKVCANWRSRAERAEAERDALREQLRLANVDAANMEAERNDMLDLTPIGPGRTVNDALAERDAAMKVIEAAKAMRDYCSVDNQGNAIITSFDAALAKLEQEQSR